MTLPPPHAGRTQLGIEVPDPDQGTPVIAIVFAMPSTMLMIYEPFEGGEVEGGHNVLGFARRWREWVGSEAPELHAREARMGFPMVIPRSCIPHVVSFEVRYHRKEDIRAGYRGPGLLTPIGGGAMARQLGNGAVEISVPTRG